LFGIKYKRDVDIIAYINYLGLDANWCKQSEQGIIAPDTIFLCDISPEEASRRSGFGDERYEQLDLQTRVYAQMQQLRQSDWTVIDARQSEQQMHEQIVEVAQNTINKCANMSLKYLHF
jgi:dTMP kinase